MNMVIRGVIWLLNAYSWMILACIIISWVPELGRNKVAELLSRLVDPFLALFRKWIPPFGALDLSPMIALALLQVAARGLASW